MIAELFESLSFSLALFFMILGLIGTVVPLIPGVIIIWLAAAGYGWVDGFETLTMPWFAALTIIALIVGTADIWLTVVGGKAGGASKRSMLYGIIGAIIGLFFGFLFGSVIGYMVGILLGEYQRHRDWNVAIKASLGSFAGMTIANLFQIAGGVLMIVLFVWQVQGNL